MLIIDTPDGWHGWLEDPPGITHPSVQLLLCRPMRSPHASSHDFSSHSWRSTLNFESSTGALRKASSLHPHQPPCLEETNRPRRRRKPRKRPLRRKKELPPWGICRLAQSGVLDSHSRLNAPLPLNLAHGPLFSTVNQIRVDCCKSCKAESLYVGAGGFSDPPAPISMR